jgi:hypothetical protein
LEHAAPVTPPSLQCAIMRVKTVLVSLEMK